MQKDLLFDVEKFVEDFNLKGVKLFVPKTYDLYSLAGASALYVYINEVCQIPTTLVADEKKIREVSDCLPEIEDPRTIKKNANDFLAIILDCASVADCDNNAWNRTFVGLQIRGQVSMKDFGAEAYNDSDAQCGAEIIFNAIQAHSAIYYTYCQTAYNYLFLAMLDATAKHKNHMKTATFEAIQEIISNGAEINIKPECFKKKRTDEMEILEHIYTQCDIVDEVGIVMFKEDKWHHLSSISFQTVLEYIRFVKLTNVWVCFVKKNDEYIIYCQGDAKSKFDLVKSLKSYKVTGSRKKAKCKIKESEIDEFLEVIHKMVADGKLKEKPRKKYTHKIKKEDAN